MQGICKVKSMIQSGYKVVFMPIYRSFLDYFVLHYVNQMHQIPTGFTFGNFEDTPRITFFDKILKSTGYMLSRRKQG